jgi:hypothetical protein
MRPTSVKMVPPRTAERDRFAEKVAAGLGDRGGNEIALHGETTRSVAIYGD